MAAPKMLPTFAPSTSARSSTSSSAGVSVTVSGGCVVRGFGSLKANLYVGILRSQSANLCAGFVGLGFDPGNLRKASPYFGCPEFQFIGSFQSQPP